MQCRLRASLLLLAAALTCGQPARAQSKAYDYAFERELIRTRFEQELRFREAAIHVAWAAEVLCRSRTQIEPFVLWSTHALRRRLSSNELRLLREETGMDEHWRVAWLDESAPDELKRGDVVVAVNGRKLPAGGTRLQLSALVGSGPVISSDDEAFWEVMATARKEADEGQPFTLTLADGRKLVSETQTGCAGSVAASAFDADANLFARLGRQRVKVPANALIEARTRDEFRWLAAFATYFQASDEALEQTEKSEGRSTGFLVGKIFALAVPGGGLLMTAVEAKSERMLMVESLVGSADLFAGEVVAALGGDPEAGLHLSERLRAQGLKVEVLSMDALRRSNAQEHARRIRELQAAHADAERREAEADAQRDEGAKAAPSVAPAASAASAANPARR